MLSNFFSISLFYYRFNLTPIRSFKCNNPISLLQCVLVCVLLCVSVFLPCVSFGREQEKNWKN